MSVSLPGILKAALAMAAAAYLLLLAAMYSFQRELQYHPQRVDLDPAIHGVQGVKRVRLATPDGETITVWHKPAPAGRPTIMYVHGNGGSLASRVRKIGTYAASDFGFLALSYRGYGDSTGTPSEEGMVTDARTAFDWLKAQGAADVMLLGESIGTGVAVQLAASRQMRALVLEAPYANAVDVGAAAYWYLPVRLLMKDQFRSTEHIAKVRVPLLIIHGTRDGLIPFEQGQKLFALANEPKSFLSVDAGHEMIGDPAVWEKELAFFRSIGF